MPIAYFFQDTLQNDNRLIAQGLAVRPRRPRWRRVKTGGGVRHAEPNVPEKSLVGGTAIRKPRYLVTTYSFPMSSRPTIVRIISRVPSAQ